MDVTEKDLDLYVDAWTKTMLTIWLEKIERLRIIRTGALHQSFKEAIQRTADGQTITMKFLYYGVYQALGTGRGYVSQAKGNFGDLEFLDKEYRHKNRLDRPRKVGPAWGGYYTSGKPRQRRDWFNKKFFSSLMAMREDLARILGEQAAYVVCNALTDPRAALKY